jgi:DNA-binding transcriptional ArsR family regulator
MSKSGQNSGYAPRKGADQAPSPVELNRALSDRTRLRIISILSTGSKSLDTITKELKLTKKQKPNVRKHLEELKKGNLLFQAERGSYCLVCPELTNNILEFLGNAWTELNETNSSLVRAKQAYNNYIITRHDKDKSDFQKEFDTLFEKTFSQIGGQLRAYYIDMARYGDYDFGRLRKI